MGAHSEAPGGPEGGGPWGYCSTHITHQHTGLYQSLAGTFGMPVAISAVACTGVSSTACDTFQPPQQPSDIKQAGICCCPSGVCGANNAP